MSRRSSVSGGMFGVVALLLVLLLMAVTNPGQAAHEKVIQEDVEKEDTLASVLGMGFISAKLVDYKDFVIFSVTEYEGEIVSIGVLSKIWIVEDNSLTG